VDGQRVAVHARPCLGVLTSAPAEWLAKLKPRGAFLDASAAKIGLSPAWLILGAYVLLGLIFGALAAHRAFSVGRDPRLWLAVGFLTNVVGYVALLALPRQEVRALAGVPAGLTKVAATYSPETCPACGAENHPSARHCSACGGTLQARFVAEVQKVGLRAD
jgi:ribosomal protein L40E